MFGARIVSTGQRYQNIVKVVSIYSFRTKSVHVNAKMDGIHGVQQMIGSVLTGNERKSVMNELDKLGEYLKGRGIKFIRIDEEGKWGRHQIVVMGPDGKKEWDAICHRGSYGYEQGLLEIYGNIVDIKKDGDSVVGWLTAKDVIERIS